MAVSYGERSATDSAAQAMAPVAKIIRKNRHPTLFNLTVYAPSLLFDAGGCLMKSSTRE
jgi:hypothetical protein